MFSSSFYKQAFIYDEIYKWINSKDTFTVTEIRLFFNCSSIDITSDMSKRISFVINFLHERDYIYIVSHNKEKRTYARRKPIPFLSIGFRLDRLWFRDTCSAILDLMSTENEQHIRDIYKITGLAATEVYRICVILKAEGKVVSRKDNKSNFVFWKKV